MIAAQMASTVRLITFDVTNTLICVRAGVGAQYSRLAKQFAGIELDENKLNLDFKKYFHEQNRLYPSYGYYAGISSYKWWSELVHKLLKSQNVPETRPNLYESFSDYLFHEFEKEHLWQKYPDCDHVLKSLKALDYKIGIISNFDERLEKILLALKMREYFSFVLTPSRCNGLSKPDKSIFLEAFKRGNVKSPSEYVHIGDSYELDFKPAVELQFRSILMSHNKKQPLFNESKAEEYEAVFKKDMYATNLIELLNKITSF